jgi:hypothetical protein
MIDNTPFHAIVTQLNALTEKLKHSTNEDERRALLKEFRRLLDQADARTISEC